MSILKLNGVQIGQSLTAANNFTWYQPATPDGTVRFGNGNAGSVTDLVTLTSAGNLGIGTSSPTVYGSYKTLEVRAAGGGLIQIGTGATTGALLFSDGAQTQLVTLGATPLGLGTNSVVRATLDSSGNLGLGVTPTTGLNGVLRYIELGPNIKGASFAGFASSTNLQTWVSNNTYYDSVGDRYAVTGSPASMFRCTNGTFDWRSTGTTTGTAGASCSLSTFMTLDASGNLGIGETSPSSYGKLTVTDQAAPNGGTYLAVRGGYPGYAGAYGYGLKIYDKDNTTPYFIVGSDYTFTINKFTSLGTYTTALKLDATGTLLVGTTTQTLSSVANFYKTATGTNQRVASFINNGTPGVYSPAGLIVSYPNAAGGNGSTFLQCSDGTTDRLYILGSGNVQNTNNSYGAISDISVKENIVDATPKLDDLLKVKIRSFNLKGENVKQIGVVAQELEEIFPGMIEENDNGLKGVKYSVFVPMLVKAIQELTTRLEALEAK